MSGLRLTYRGFVRGVGGVLVGRPCRLRPWSQNPRLRAFCMRRPWGKKSIPVQSWEVTPSDRSPLRFHTMVPLIDTSRVSAPSLAQAPTCPFAARLSQAGFPRRGFVAGFDVVCDA